MQTFEIQDLYDAYHSAQDDSEKLKIGMDNIRKLFNAALYDEVRQHGFDVLNLSESLHDKDIYFRVIMHMSRSFVQQGDYISPREHLDKAMAVAKELDNHFFLMSVYLDLSGVEKRCSNNQLALEYLSMAESICESHNDNENLATVYTNFGLFYDVLKKYDLALYYTKKGLRLTSSDRIVGKYKAIGTLYLHTKDYALALGYMKKALKIFMDKESLGEVTACYLTMGNIYTKKKQLDKAEFCLNIGMQSAQEQQNNEAYATAIIHYIELCIAQNKRDQSIAYLEEYKGIEPQLHEKNTLRDHSLLVSEFYKQLKDYQEAYHYYTLHIQYRDEIYNIEKQNNLEIMAALREYEHKKKEAEIFQLKNVELAKSYMVIEEKNAELVTLSDQKDTTMNMVSHDLKNYIGSAQNALEIALLKDTSLADNKYMKIIGNSCVRALDLVKDILYINKLEVTEADIVKETLDINEIIKSSHDSYTIKAKNKDIFLVIDYWSEPLFCSIAIDKFHRIIENLVSNAIKFTNKQGTVKVITRKESGYAYLHFIDSGIGMSEDLLSKLFQRFSKAGRTGTAGEESTGMGLYIVKKLIELHDGTVEVKSVVGEGTEFIVKVPLVSIS